MEEKKSLPVMDAVEIRVLGSLVEKYRTTPDYYPMTLNSIILACNQKSSRKPIVQYSNEIVLNALNTLKSRGLIGTVTGAGSRTIKYKHHFDTVYSFNLAEMAVLCLLFLRGPLTAGEINSNSGRIYEFASIESILMTLEKLSTVDTHFIKQLPREAGQKEHRFIHLFSGFHETQQDELPKESLTNEEDELEIRLEKLEKDFAELKSSFEKLYKDLMG